MPFVTRKSMLTLGVLGGAGAVVAGVFVWSGIYNIGADDTHTKPVYALLQSLRENSINHRAKSIQVPDLTDPALIRQGAGNYNAMCTGCHLKPGIEETELSKGLYPAPPAFTKAQVNDPAHHFWVIKHGIKASGMPAWGKSMKDDYIWSMVAFLQQLPKLDEAQYKALVASSGGHSHGGGETGEHHHEEGMGDDHHDEGEADHHHEEGAEHDMAGMDMKCSEQAAHPHDEATPAQGVTHVHADGTKHVHAPAAQATPAPTKAATTSTTQTSPAVEEEHHDHQH